ncbi:CHRD domain-containing protein [Geomesophilobacter sediminis]|uniref:CHRD domain-containing protein n=1 Tax=Geomesophilobacter sediminis TaxID=2798584 RepID=A0A8J7J7B3_9BACT|nr:CHRD domain-containing protein [Geomesophilobacter sediminis]MBJ6725021.1 CHRD domain-containing protein [Geomesophilobacter sediminis]
MRRMKFMLLVVLSVLVTTSLCWGAGTKRFHAKMKGDDEVPAVKTKATGTAEFALSKDGKELAYKVSVKNIVSPNAAHIHLGKKGESGGPVLDLFKGQKKRQGKVSGLLAQGIASDKDLIGDLQGKTLADLVAQIKAGDAYVNVHTEAFPDGEIRGQIK